MKMKYVTNGLLAIYNLTADSQIGQQGHHISRKGTAQSKSIDFSSFSPTNKILKQPASEKVISTSNDELT